MTKLFYHGEEIYMILHPVIRKGVNIFEHKTDFRFPICAFSRLCGAYWVGKEEGGHNPLTPTPSSSPKNRMVNTYI